MIMPDTYTHPDSLIGSFLWFVAPIHQRLLMLGDFMDRMQRSSRSFEAPVRMSIHVNSWKYPNHIKLIRLYHSQDPITSPLDVIGSVESYRMVPSDGYCWLMNPINHIYLSLYLP